MTPATLSPDTHDDLSATSLRARDVADLTMTAGYPCISVLMSTEPGPRLSGADLASLQDLVREVHLQLLDQAVPSRRRLIDQLDQLVTTVAGQPADRGLAVYVSLAVCRAFRLSTPVATRAVVEHTFATRDLVQALHRTPPHVVLVLDESGARLLDRTSSSLTEVTRLTAPAGADGGAGGRDGGLAQDQLDAFLHEVDRQLGEHRREHPSPLVIAGPEPMVARFTRISRNLARLAGRASEAEAADLEALAAACDRILEDYLRSRRDEALGLLRETWERRRGDVARGMAQAWHAVHTRAPQMLLVEEDFIHPGPRIGAQPDGAQDGIADPSRGLVRHAGVHDLVDDLIEVVIVRGGQLALVGSGDLAEHGRVVLLSRPASRTPGPRSRPA